MTQSQRNPKADGSQRGLLVDENVAMNATRRLPVSAGTDVADCIAEIERGLGRRLSTPQRSLALQRRRAGQSAVEIADWLYRQEAARLTVNDPLERRRDTPVRRDRV